MLQKKQSRISMQKKTTDINKISPHIAKNPNRYVKNATFSLTYSLKLAFTNNKTLLLFLEKLKGCNHISS